MVVFICCNLRKARIKLPKEQYWYSSDTVGHIREMMNQV